VTFKLIKLDSRTDPHVANLRQDYTKIQEAAVNKKRAKVFDDWANEVIKATYIEVIPEYSDCPNLKSWLDRSN
jgi:peptidyl-prolyl cis-trans isomerase SurA